MIDLGNIIGQAKAYAHSEEGKACLIKCLANWVRDKEDIMMDVSDVESFMTSDDWQKVVDAAGKSLYVIGGILTSENQLQEAKDLAYTKEVNNAFYEAASKDYFKPKSETLELAQCDLDMIGYALNHTDWSEYNPEDFGGEDAEVAANIHFVDIMEQLGID